VLTSAGEGMRDAVMHDARAVRRGPGTARFGALLRWSSVPCGTPGVPSPGGLPTADTARHGVGQGVGVVGEEAPMLTGIGEVKYYVLVDRAAPYLLARVRWPDVAQAISAASPDWVDDPGLFDLPYDAGAITLDFEQATAVAAGWGAQVLVDAAELAPSYIRRMPANWSDLSPSERDVWGIELSGRRRPSAWRTSGLRALRERFARPRGATGAGGAPAAADADHAGADGGVQTVADERRAQARARLGGRAHIRLELTTLSAGLVDLGERGMRCVLPEAPPLVAPGAALGGPVVLEAEMDASRICLDVGGRVSWERTTRDGTQFGVEFDDLGGDELEGVRLLIAAAGASRDQR
jgi:hypothetical protein